MASLEEPSEPSTFVHQRTSSQVNSVDVSTGVRANPATFSHLGHAKGTRARE